MLRLNYAEVGIDVDKVINAMIRDFGENTIISKIGEDTFISKIGEKRVLKDLIKRVGKDKIRKMLEEK